MIRKYPNRRLYDTEQSRYITCDELAAMMLKARGPVSVQNSKREDVTAEVYATIVSDLVRKGSIAPAALLPLILAALQDPDPFRVPTSPRAVGGFT